MINNEESLYTEDDLIQIITGINDSDYLTSSNDTLTPREQIEWEQNYKEAFYFTEMSAARILKKMDKEKFSAAEIKILELLTLKFTVFIHNLDRELYIPVMMSIRHNEIIDQCFELMLIESQRNEKTPTLTNLNIETIEENHPFYRLHSIQAKEFFIPNSPINNNLSNIIKAGFSGINYAKTINAAIYEDKNIKDSIQISEYDKLVHDTIYTLFLAGNRIITPTQIYRTMNGLTNTEDVTKTTQDKIRESIEKHMGKRVVINGESLYKFKDGSRIIELDRQLLPFDKIKLKHSNGTIEAGYSVTAMPPLLSYALSTGQIVQFPVELLNASKYLPQNSPTITMLKVFIIYWIKILANEKNNMNNRKITYEKIFEKCGFPPMSKQLQKQKREIIKRICMSLKENNEIIDYEEYKEGKNVKGLIFKLPNDLIENTP